MQPAEIAKKQREIIIAQLELASPKLHFSDGADTASHSRDDLIELIKNGDPAGDEYVRTQWEFLKAVKSGELTKIISG